MAVRRSRRTLFSENELTGLSAAPVNSTQVTQEMLQQTAWENPSRSPGGEQHDVLFLQQSWLAPHAPSPPTAPSHTQLWPRTLDPAPLRAAKGSWQGCSARAQTNQTQSSPGRRTMLRASLISWASPSFCYEVF